MLRGQLLSSNIALNTSRELLHFLLRYLWPPLTFSPSADRQNSVLQNLRTSICKGEAHKLKPTSSNLLPSCLVPRLAYALPLSSAFIRVCWRNRFWQYPAIDSDILTSFIDFAELVYHKCWSTTITNCSYVASSAQPAEVTKSGMAC